MLVMVVGLAGAGGCAGETPPTKREVRVRGRLERAGMSSYMYGTHRLFDRRRQQAYALRGSGVDLDAHVGRRVLVVGTPVKGYPVDGGPPYLEVHSIRRPGTGR